MPSKDEVVFLAEWTQEDFGRIFVQDKLIPKHPFPQPVGWAYRVARFPSKNILLVNGHMIAALSAAGRPDPGKNFEWWPYLKVKVNVGGHALALDFTMDLWDECPVLGMMVPWSDRLDFKLEVHSNATARAEVTGWFTADGEYMQWQTSGSRDLRKVLKIRHANIDPVAAFRAATDRDCPKWNKPPKSQPAPTNLSVNP